MRQGFWRCLSFWAPGIKRGTCRPGPGWGLTGCLVFSVPDILGGPLLGTKTLVRGEEQRSWNLFQFSTFKGPEKEVALFIKRREYVGLVFLIGFRERRWGREKHGSIFPLICASLVDSLWAPTKHRAGNFGVSGRCSSQRSSPARARLS